MFMLIRALTLAAALGGSASAIAQTPLTSKQEEALRLFKGWIDVCERATFAQLLAVSDRFCFALTDDKDLLERRRERALEDPDDVIRSNREILIPRCARLPEANRPQACDGIK
jgi:hypothetical protein